MKSRSHRLPVSNPQDDWVDGSWTVDCVCGVNFDDGEEMVNCDECGVWVHTRCVRYVKSEKLFACDKCKNKARRNDSEETEVAQLLVELPTKTLRMNSPYPNSSSVPTRRPFGLWTELPMEERVHVQGVPGGDPALFTGLSSVFCPELWKCSGYVPKKFNFKHRESPCWENETREAHENNTSDKGNDMTANGAGALFSLSKENCLIPPIVKPVAERPVIKSNSVMDSDATTRSTNDVKKGTGLLSSSMLQGSKRKREEFRSGKKKSKIVEKEGFLKKDAHVSRPDRGPMAVKTDIQKTKFGNSREVQPAVNILEGHRVQDQDTTSCSDIPTSSDRLPKTASFDVSKHRSTSEAHPQEDKIRNHVPARVEDSLMENDGAATILERSGSASLPVTDEVVTNATNNKEVVAVSSLGVESRMAEPMTENVTCFGPDNNRHQNVESSSDDKVSDDKVICSSEPDAKLTADARADPEDLESQRSLPNYCKLDITKSSLKSAGTSSGSLSEKAEPDITTTVNSEYNERKAEEGDRRAMDGDNKTTNTDESPTALCQSNQEPKISEGAVGVRKSSGHRQNLKATEEAPRSNLAVTNPLSAPNHHKVVASMGKSSSVTTKSSAPENRTSSKAHKHDLSSRPRGISETNHSNKRESSSMDSGRDEERCERVKKKLKELPKSSVGSASKTLHSTKLSHASGKKMVSEAKDSVPNSSAKTSTGRSNSATSRSAESSSTSLQSESASHIPNKAAGTHLTQKGEKLNQTSCQPSSKVVNTHLMHPPSSSAPSTLSDEELALLLHQELNSSPRVPRVPRMRHTGSLPQLTSPTATSTLLKRTSSGGGKDHGLTPKRKSKDIGKDGSNCSLEVIQETKKSERSSSPGCRREEDSAIKRERDSGSTKSVHSLKKSNKLASNTSASSSLRSPNEQNLSAVHSSPSAAAADDTKSVAHPSHRTLPALLAEIMSKGQRMTYEELCSIVLPHWPNLRKHNGERYAYSSHSQAVLDCLRNRSEWACLVDRGPKTGTTRKRRKHDVDSHLTESEDNEDCTDRAVKDVRIKALESNPEEVPKGKRKARKRRRLALQGRGIVRRRRRAEVVSEEEIASFSESGDDSLFSEDEVQGGGTRNEASASSDERTTKS